jgi:hypothetical protein
MTQVAVVNMEKVKAGVPTVPPDPAEDVKLIFNSSIFILQ